MERRGKGAYLEFAFRGTGAAVQYRRVKDGPAPIATAVVDENPETACVLDGTFDETWGDKMQLDNGGRAPALWGNTG